MKIKHLKVAALFMAASLITSSCVGSFSLFSKLAHWNKGATSGHLQKVVSIYADCDNDTLLLNVKQTGAACHTGSYSCFFNEIYNTEEE